MDTTIRPHRGTFALSIGRNTSGTRLASWSRTQRSLPVLVRTRYQCVCELSSIAACVAGEIAAKEPQSQEVSGDALHSAKKTKAAVAYATAARLVQSTARFRRSR